MKILHPIAPHGCGCDGGGALETLISIDVALGLILARTNPVEETETLPLGLALGRTLATPVNAVCMNPPFDNAAMDGYAVMASALVGDGPRTLDVVARVPRGNRQSGPFSISSPPEFSPVRLSLPGRMPS